jgi:ribosome-binding factor A
MSSLRLQRVRELLKRELGEIIRREIPVGDAGLITVNDVTVGSDLHAATVYIGILGGEEQRKKALSELDRHRKRIQGLVGKAVILKYTPQLRFILDESIEQGNKVLKIIDELEHAAPSDENTPKDN